MIYLIRDTLSGFVKIGFSDDPWARLVKMQADCPGELSLEALIDGDREAEAALHKRFADSRHRGEWFCCTDELEALIALHAVSRPERHISARSMLRKRLRDATGCSHAAVEYWIRRRRIPGWHWAAISRAGIATLEELGTAAANRTIPPLFDILRDEAA